MRLWRKKTHRKTNKNGNQFIWIRSNGDRIEEPNISGLSIEFHGSNNIVTIHGDQTAFLNCSIICHGDNSTIDIGEFTLNTSDGVCIANLVIYTNKGANVKIGKDFSCGGCEIIADNLGADVEIGDDCMFSNEIVIRSTDGHTIIKNGKKINPGQPVKIGNHCWLGRRSSILKGSVIPDNSIVGFGAVVLAKTPTTQGGVYAGIPAIVVDSKINWSRVNYDDFK